MCPFITTARDGFHSDVIKAMPNYHPNRFEIPKVQQMDGNNYATSAEAIKQHTKMDPNFQTFAPYELEAGTFGRLRAPKVKQHISIYLKFLLMMQLVQFAEHVNQAQLFYNSLSPVEQEHIKSAAQFELGRVDSRLVQERMMARFAEIDYDMAVDIAEGFGLPVEKPKNSNNKANKSNPINPFSQLSEHNEYPVTGKQIGIFALDGFDATQVATFQKVLGGMGNIVQM